MWIAKVPSARSAGFMGSHFSKQEANGLLSDSTIGIIKAVEKLKAPTENDVDIQDNRAVLAAEAERGVDARAQEYYQDHHHVVFLLPHGNFLLIRCCQSPFLDRLLLQTSLKLLRVPKATRDYAGKEAGLNH